MKLIFATQNQGKLKEIKDILKDLNIEVLSLENVGITEEIAEDGKTCIENALKKASYVAKESGHWALADDTGLCIKELKGAPGVMTARWAGAGADLVKFTLEKMKNIPQAKRQAYFETIAALVSPDNQSWTFEGRIDGQITQKPLGKNRVKLPYDLIFRPQGFKKTFAEMTDEEKNNISHRGKAFRKLKNFLASNLVTE